MCSLLLESAALKNGAPSSGVISGQARNEYAILTRSAGPSLAMFGLLVLRSFKSWKFAYHSIKVTSVTGLSASGVGVRHDSDGLPRSNGSGPYSLLSGAGKFVIIFAPFLTPRTMASPTPQYAAYSLKSSWKVSRSSRFCSRSSLPRKLAQSMASIMGEPSMRFPKQLKHSVQHPQYQPQQHLEH